jgi:ferrous iron transport protein A
MPVSPIMPDAIPVASLPPLPLHLLSEGAQARVCALNGNPEICQRLREMGFCESAIITKISGRHTLLCHVCGARIALSAQMAKFILVEPLRRAS